MKDVYHSMMLEAVTDATRFMQEMSHETWDTLCSYEGIHPLCKFNDDIEFGCVLITQPSGDVLLRLPFAKDEEMGKVDIELDDETLD
jgi:hypothetical protein